MVSAYSHLPSATLGPSHREHGHPPAGAPFICPHQNVTYTVMRRTCGHPVTPSSAEFGCSSSHGHGDPTLQQREAGTRPSPLPFPRPRGGRTCRSPDTTGCQRALGPHQSVRERRVPQIREGANQRTRRVTESKRPQEGSGRSQQPFHSATLFLTGSTADCPEIIAGKSPAQRGRIGDSETEIICLKHPLRYDTKRVFSVLR